MIEQFFPMGAMNENFPGTAKGEESAMGRFPRKTLHRPILATWSILPVRGRFQLLPFFLERNGKEDRSPRRHRIEDRGRRLQTWKFFLRTAEAPYEFVLQTARGPDRKTPPQHPLVFETAQK